MDIKNKKLFVFDMDKTLTLSKQPMDEEMCFLLSRILEKKNVSIISGGKYEVFRDIYLRNLKIEPELLNKLYLFPTCGSAFYKYSNNAIQKVYSEEIPQEGREKIFKAFYIMFDKIGFKIPDKLWGELIEDRITSVAFSAFGQNAPLDIKSAWDPDKTKRVPMIRVLQELLPEFDVKIGGATTIDVTRKGINKAYGIKKMTEHLGFAKDEMTYFGDDFGEGGNDYPVMEAGVDCIPVENPEDTKSKLKGFISSF
jgi:HAD superfamily hydrolase (TIGR01484 family)